MRGNLDLFTNMPTSEEIIKELSPCPFCGAHGMDVEVQPLAALHRYYVGCLLCDSNGPTGEDKIEAVKFWNQRAARTVGEMEK